MHSIYTQTHNVCIPVSLLSLLSGSLRTTYFHFFSSRFEGTGLLQHGSYAICCKCTTQENSLVLEVNTKKEILFHALVIELSEDM